MISSHFNEKLKILETDFKDDINEADILKYLSSFRENTTYPRHLKTLVDASEANFIFSYRSLKAFNQARVKSLENYCIVVTAVIVNSPTTAAIATLYQALVRDKKYKYKVFSTHKAAKDWLNSFILPEENIVTNHTTK